ncbi:MAG: polysaccharide biosynthesis/export family protein [Acidobacteria bacterium]|nr:polysaccharide biosynthesis/export family protein [Acidobacteriota bacterium]MBI3279543.1 polysaccharide biosynthesis/export family protein [Acidobacteriota bacterium]
MKHVVSCLGLALFFVCGAAWAQERKDEQQQPPPEKRESRPTPAEAASGPAAPVDPKTYSIGPEDILLIQVWREQELTRPVQVRPDGRFTMPLIGDVKAAGLTPEQLAQNITEALGNFINKPQVMVSVQSVQSKKYYITGAVNRTGMYPLVLPVTVLEALSNAGGFREFADTKNIIIMRGTQRLKFNYKDVVKGKKLEQNIPLQDGDHIIVPE